MYLTLESLKRKPALSSGHWTFPKWCFLLVCFFVPFSQGSSSYCKPSKVLIVLNDEPDDSSTYFSYIAFAQGLSRKFDKESFSLLTYSPSEKTFTIVFKSKLGADIPPSMWLKRGISAPQNTNIYDGFENMTSIVALDTELPPSFKMCYGRKMEAAREESALKRCLRISTRSHHMETLTVETIRANDESLVEIVNIGFKDHMHFIYKFEDTYNELCSFGINSALTNEQGEEYCEESTVCGVQFSVQVEHITISVIIGKKKFTAILFYSLLLKELTFVDWFAANKECMKSKLALLSPKEDRWIQEIVPIFNSLLEGLDLEALSVVRMPLSLTRSSASIRRQFYLSPNKDLLFSNWAAGEPKGDISAECVLSLWGGLDLTFINLGWDWEELGWKAVDCMDKIFSTVICQEPPQLPGGHGKAYTTDVITSDEEIIARGAFGRVQGSGMRQSSRLTSMSVALAYGLVDLKMKEYEQVEILGLVQGEVLLVNQVTQKDILSDLRLLVYHCGDGGTPPSVPYSKVCDGKKDCSSGKDETSCGKYGYAPCTPAEWICLSRQCIPTEARCDLVIDCQDGTDEENCEVKRCRYRECPSRRCVPKPWFGDGQEDCEEGYDETGEELMVEECVFLCNRTQCVTRQMLNDSIADCKGPEGPLDETLGALESMNCTKKRRASITNNWSPKCVLARDSFGEVIGCANFQHLSDCKNFNCPRGYVKCPKSYCIPLGYLMDGKEDCLNGEDETHEVMPNLENTFQCHPRTEQFVPLSAVCDGKRDCIQGEDELGCGIECVPGFICISGSVSAFRFNKSQPLKSLNFIDKMVRYLDLSGVSSKGFFQTFSPGHFNHLLVLNLSGCDIESVSLRSRRSSKSQYTSNLDCDTKASTNDFKTVQNLDLSGNVLKEVKDCSFLRLMKGVKQISLSQNGFLAHVSEKAFSGLSDLKILDMSFTQITYLHKETFSTLYSLERLVLTGTPLEILDLSLPPTIQYFYVNGMNIKDVAQHTFSKILSLKKVRSSSNKLCCSQFVSSHVSNQMSICQPLNVERSYCNYLVEELFLRVFIWFVSVGILGGNIVTLAYRLAWDRELLRKPYGLFVTNLGLADLLMGVYLMMIAIADVISQGEYVFHDYKWRNSYICWIAGVLATLSGIASTLFIALITVDRFLAVRYPFGDFRIRAHTMIVLVAVVWVFSTSIASLPLMPFAKDWIVLSNSGMCLGLPLKGEKLPGWQYSLTVYVGLNFLLFLLIGIGQGAVYHTIRVKGKNTKRNMNPNSQLRQNQRMQEFAIAKQLSLIVLTNFVCWCPVITMGMIALFGQDAGDAAYRWSAIALLPINSALNPLLYTLPAIQTKWSNFWTERNQAKRTLALAANKQRRARQGRPSKIQKIAEICMALRVLRQRLMRNSKQKQKQTRMDSLTTLSCKALRLSQFFSKCLTGRR